MPVPTDFRLYYGNALEVLAGLLAEELRQPAPAQPLLAPDTILIPQAAMRRWLQATLAQRHGIAANLEFLTPGEFVTRALRSNLGPDHDDLDAATLAWRLYASLNDAPLLAQPALASLATYLGDGDPLKAWTLAVELAGVFEKYQAWRRDWLLRWEAGADPHDLQAVLWRRVAGGRRHRARRLQEYLTRFDEGDAVPLGLPTRLFAFGTINVSPDVLRVMASQARAGTLHFYLPTPCQEYWGDPGSRRGRLRADLDPSVEASQDNPLLRDFGAAGRDFLSLLAGYEVVHPSGDIGAYADPLVRSADSPQDEPLRESLLHRMQSDLLHRRATPLLATRATLDRDDPSLQFHACHTRLRELQVLHDRLRALLDDPRFDPPLQPREIAVLAPDIEPYLPYLDAVFGAAGRDDAIPYAKADASLLAASPLAAAFLQLLALPVSRFGREELLDLLASPALAHAAGLDADDFGRLQDWLKQAGACWALDAAHRARHGAPKDAAYTWQFALDRLLLGHASGSEAPIAGVAPWPELEGSALQALDALLQRLRVLARYEHILREPMPPARWREQLLALLDDALPGEPPEAADRRALERLRQLIDEFARNAQVAGFESPLSPEVVRAHFTRVLGEADTRAPLLTGGVSFARMVPMRLLPFRVICLLGMNDGEFPRRDPASGLNRLTAELGTPQRRHGDRSTREDDRYLFLQLFAAAQDAFYLSWLGRHPVDDSAREASSVVTELLAAAAAQHHGAGSAVRDLVLVHPLQPFAAAAFGQCRPDGSSDPRQFSYRSQWHAAAARLAGTRRAQSPWIESGTSLPPITSAERELPLDALRRFLLDPTGQFLRQRLALRLPERVEAEEDIEPLDPPQRGAARLRLQRSVFEAGLAGETRKAMQDRLQAQGLLPSGALGGRVLERVRGELEPYLDAYARWRAESSAQSCLLAVEIDGLRLHGRLEGVHPQGLARLRFDEPNGPSILRHGLDWLLASAAGAGLGLYEFHWIKSQGAGPHHRAAIVPEQAIEALRCLLALRREGLQAPLPFGPYSGWKLFDARDRVSGLGKAAQQWRGSEQQWGEGSGEAPRLALRGRDPFADASGLREFGRVTGLVFGAVTAGRPEPIDLGGLAPPADDEAEDAA
jgi:exodeoxyribonuclease V gamma subunit